MLVLTRKIEECILLGEDIKVTVLGVSGDKVRIGIDAPRTVKILRGETVDQTREQNRISAEASINVRELLKSFAQEENEKKEE